eukprot:5378555-Amphidinium_carterae.1
MSGRSLPVVPRQQPGREEKDDMRAYIVGMCTSHGGPLRSCVLLVTAASAKCVCVSSTSYADCDVKLQCRRLLTTSIAHEL